ncbi:hypothetical protein Tco_0934401 [Tanacetum coccineum]
MSIRELQEQVAALAQAVKQYCSNRSCSCCGGPRNGGNCPGSSIDDLVPIPKESEVTSDSDLECDMPASLTDVREEDFYINSPLR